MPPIKTVTEISVANLNTVVRAVSRSSAIPDLEEQETGIIRHPLGIKPSGNALTSEHNLRDSIGFFDLLPEEIINLLLEWLDAESLIKIGATCRAFYAYSTNDQLWRDLAVREKCPRFVWRGSWRASCLALPNSYLSKINCDHLFSDILHRPFLCSHVSLSPFALTIPKHNEIARIDDLSPSDFIGSWVNKPFILTNLVKKWPLYRDWCQQGLLEKFGETVFRAEAVDWPLHTYIDYMNNNMDESPLYLFDQGFVEKMNLLVGREGEYWPPECFGEDLFTLLGDQRPDHRWLIIGPERSGSTFHKDPNATSAWNAVIKGSKYWIMFPSAILPPGVYVSEDQSEVTSPLSIGEWLLSFHEEARRTAGCIEGICREGEVLHVPSGWWHLVINLEPAIAITQNFVPVSHLSAAVAFLKNKPDQISGFKSDVQDPHGLFLERLEDHHPELLVKLEEGGGKKRKWNEVVHDTDEENHRAEGFAFNFCSDIAEEEEL